MKTPSKNLLLQLLAGLGESVVLVDVARRPWRTVYFNPKLLHLLHAQAGEIAGQNAEKLLFRIAGNDAVEAVRSCGEDRPQVPFEGEYLRADQPTRLVTGRVLKLSGSDQLRAIIMRDADMSDADTAGATGTTISILTLDSVTGMMQRDAFLEVLQRDCAIAAREQAWIAILVLRIDAFDAYRGTFGQHASDSALKRVAAIIRRCLRRTGDTPVRAEDDAFAVLVHGSNAAQAAEFAERIAAEIKALAIHHPKSPVAPHMTATTAAVAEVPSQDLDPADLLARALSRAKPVKADVRWTQANG